jgi:hypothetical protein
MKRASLAASGQRSPLWSGAASTLLAVLAIGLGIWVQSPRLHLSLAARAGIALAPVMLTGAAGRCYRVESNRKGFVPFIVWVAGIWTGTGAGLAICHIMPRLPDWTFWIALALIAAGCLTWWATRTSRWSGLSVLQRKGKKWES